MIAAFATKTFNVSGRSIYTFTDFNTSSTLQTEKQDVEGKKPKTYIKGVDLETMQFVINLKASLGHNLETEYNGWKSLQKAAKPYVFILGSKPYGDNKWLLKSVTIDGVAFDGQGKMIEAKLTLQFEEYASAGSAAASKSSNTARTSIDIDSLVGKDTKAEEKRLNPSMQRALAKGLSVG